MRLCGTCCAVESLWGFFLVAFGVFFFFFFFLLAAVVAHSVPVWYLSPSRKYVGLLSRVHLFVKIESITLSLTYHSTVVRNLLLRA
jgi:hypothetical protein